MKVIVASMYEQGHQSLSCLAVAAEIRSAGHEADIFDYDRQESYDSSLFDRLATADALVISVPMHTASAIALHVLERVVRIYPDLPCAFFGLYATALSDADLPNQVTLLASGEARSDVVNWLGHIQGYPQTPWPERVVISRKKEPTKLDAQKLDRSALPSLSNYAKLKVGDSERIVGYTEASRGCLHSCTHCPVPVVYGGRMRINDPQWVLDDIDQLVTMGAKHITFGDPDFFNAPVHSMRILRAMNRRHPDLTFDATIKVQHLIEHQRYLPELASLGCAFLVSAFEHVSDVVLEKLRKEHTRKDIETALALTRRAGIEIRPSLLPFTPWTTPEDIIDLFNFVIEQDLINNVDPIQLTIRLLVPRGSLLLSQPVSGDTFLESTSDPLGFTWKSRFSQLDHLAGELAHWVEIWLSSDSPSEIFDKMYRLACEVLGMRYVEPDYRQFALREVPQLSESWFCCAEPAPKMLARSLDSHCDS